MVVDIVEVPETEILLDEALAYDPKAKVGFPCVMHLDTKKFGRIAAQTAKHVIRQGIREAERSQMLEQFQEKGLRDRHRHRPEDRAPDRQRHRRDRP